MTDRELVALMAAILWRPDHQLYGVHVAPDMLKFSIGEYDRKNAIAEARALLAEVDRTEPPPQVTDTNVRYLCPHCRKLHASLECS